MQTLTGVRRVGFLCEHLGMTPLAKKELAKMVFMVLLALNLAMNLMHTFDVAQVAAVQVLNVVVTAGLFVALLTWFVLARRLKRRSPARND